jgi:DNA-binding transcriptional ArsR family regulator
MKPWVDITDARVVKALAHPLRVRILSLLDEGELSPTELSEKLGVPIGNVSYHVRQLAGLGLIRLTRETPRRGAVEHHYTAEARPLITDKAWREAPEIVRQAMVGAALEEAAQAVNSAAESGGFSRDGAHISRIPTALDERGWHELAEELAETMKRLRRIAEASQRRLRKASHDGELHGTAVMMLFEDAPVRAEAGSADSGMRTRPRRTTSKSTR